MTFTLENAVVYDVESFPNLFTLDAQQLFNENRSTWEISQYRDDRRQLFEFFDWLHKTQTPMIAFNSLRYDYPMIHFIWNNPSATVEAIYARSKEILSDYSPFGQQVWLKDRFAPQVDLFRINHFDNKAKTTSLKALQFNMRSPSVEESPVEFDTFVGPNEVAGVIHYNGHDVGETKRFALHCMDAINFRIGMLDTLKGDVLNFNDTKIGEQLLIQRIGEDICYDKPPYGSKKPRQTLRNRIALRDIIFPYISFDNPEFARVLAWFKNQVLTPEDIEDPDAPAQTKGVFKGVEAHVGGVDFKFGTGGIHASVTPQRILSDENYQIWDWDVAGYYPAAAIVNRVAPAHLGEAYIREYTKLPIERKEWQKKKGKKCVEANGLKLAGNGVYGKSNSPFSPFYDPQYTLTITVNCQLLLCMLAERLVKIPTLQMIQANTDGLTYRIHKDFQAQAEQTCKEWEAFTCLTLESAQYNRMFIRDVNNYVAESMDGTLKQKGAYWHPDPHNYAKSISECQPPAWHKDLGNTISIQAAVIAMVKGIDPAITIPMHTDKFDFMLRAKVNGQDKLMLGDRQMQKVTRYYVAKRGQPMHKVSPEKGPLGAPKRAQKVSEADYLRVMNANGWQWDATVCTKNKSVYGPTISQIEAGYMVAECNDADRFDFTNVNYDYYIAEARKLII